MDSNEVATKTVTRGSSKTVKPPIKVDVSKKLRKIMDSAMPMPYAVILDFIVESVVPGEFAVSPEPENDNKPFTFKATGVVAELLLDEGDTMQFSLKEDECNNTLIVKVVNPSHRFTIGQHIQCFGYIGPVSVGKYALLLEAAEDKSPGPGQPDFIVCHPFRPKNCIRAGKKGRGKRVVPAPEQDGTAAGSQSIDLAVSVEASTLALEDLSLVEKTDDLTVANCGNTSHPIEYPALGVQDDMQEDLLDLNFGQEMGETIDYKPPVVEEQKRAHLSIDEQLQVLLKQNEIMMRMFAAPHYRALAAKIFRKINIYHMRAVEQLFRNKGYGEDWLAVVTSALASSAGEEVAIVSFDASLDAEVQRAVDDFPYTLDMERPLSQRAVGDHDRVIYDIFVLYDELKPFC